MVENGKITVDTNTEVGQAMASNPRTAIGIIDENHYIIVVSDGRTSESEGLSLYQLAEVMKSYGERVKANPSAYYFPEGFSVAPTAFTDIRILFPLPASEAALSPYF